MPSNAFNMIAVYTFLHFLTITARMNGWYKLEKKEWLGAQVVLWLGFWDKAASLLLYASYSCQNWKRSKQVIATHYRVTASH